MPFRPEHLGCRHRRQLARLVGVAENDLAGLEWALLRVGRRNAAPFDCGLADAVLETERGASGRELVTVLTPDHLDTRQTFLRLPGPLRERLQARLIGRKNRECDVHLGGPERLLPLLRAALADIAEHGRTRRHPLSELGREAVERFLRDAERLETVVGESNRDPGVAPWIGRAAAGVDERE